MIGDLLVRLCRRREAVSSPDMSGLSFFIEAAYRWPRKNTYIKYLDVVPQAHLPPPYAEDTGA